MAFPCKSIGTCNDIGGGWFWWAFRHSVALTGHYHSAKTAEDYYSRLASEVNRACEAEKLDCDPERTSIIPPWHSGFFRPLLKTFSRGVIYLVDFEGFKPYSERSVVLSDDSLFFFRDITGENIAPRGDVRSLVITGWAFSPQHTVNLSLYRENGDMAEYSVDFRDSPDVYSHFLYHRNARKARFEIKANCYEECFLYAKIGDTVIEHIPIKDIRAGSQLIRKPELLLYIETVIKKDDILPNQNKLAMMKAEYLTGIAKIYQAISPIAIILALTVYGVATVQILRTRSIAVLYTIISALIIAMMARLFILSVIDISLFPALTIRLLSPVYPLLLIVIMLSLIGYEKLIFSQIQGSKKIE
jgi:hypothetical protein